MNAMGLLRNSIWLTRQSLSLSSPARYVYGKQILSPSASCVLRKEAELTMNQVRKHCTHPTVPNPGPKQAPKGTGRKILKYVSGFIGACILTAVGVRVYKIIKYKMKGIEPVRNRHFGRRNAVYTYRGYVLPGFVVDKIDEIEAFDVREDDIWIVGAPKTGTTWLAEVIYLIHTEGNYEGAKSQIDGRFPYFEYFYPGLKAIEKTPSPRYMKTHLPFSLLPKNYEEKKPKTIFITRNPKDTLVSFHFFLQEFFVKSMWHLSLSLDDFSQLYADGQAHYGPWWKHTLEGWDRRNDDNVLFITYEDMKLDLPGSIKKIASFLGKNVSAQDVEAIASHCSFDEMKKNNFVNYNWYKDRGFANKHGQFMRKGKIGDWKNHNMSKEIEAKLDDTVATKLEPAGFKFRDVSKVDEQK